MAREGQELGIVTGGDNFGVLETVLHIARRAGGVLIGEQYSQVEALIWVGCLDQAKEVLNSGGDIDEHDVRIRLALLGHLNLQEGKIEEAIQSCNSMLDSIRSNECRLNSLEKRAELLALCDVTEALLEMLEENSKKSIKNAIKYLTAARQLIDSSENVFDSEEDLQNYLLRLDLLQKKLEICSENFLNPLLLKSMVDKLERNDLRDVVWNGLSWAGALFSKIGLKAEASRLFEDAISILERQALIVPRELRNHFWNVSSRGKVKKHMELIVSSSLLRSESRRWGWGMLYNARWLRLLEITKRLASERDLDRLLERIIESAVELSGAERGLLLIVKPDGSLEPRIVRGTMELRDPHVEFSRSIAEAVLIDGEPIVTADAQTDGLLRPYRSVHHLRLRSVACIPIRSVQGVEGVLYVEDRFCAGKFGEEEVELLLALADQAAIALSNAKYLTELELHRQQLVSINNQLNETRLELLRLLNTRTEELEQAKEELRITRESLASSYFKYGMVAQSRGMRRVIQIIDRVKDASVPVVVFGESGTGKELVARAIHYSGSRKNGPFIAVNCAAIPEQLLENELFGHVKGAFTGADKDRQGLFERASGGTLFLDEIDAMSQKMQVSLLRVLQDGRIQRIGSEHEIEINVRIIASSDRRLIELVKAGHFREDLYYRLNVVEIRVPPLRERMEDLPLLCDQILQSIAKREGKPPKRLTREAFQILADCSWPGNVRQLEHVLLNAFIMSDDQIIRPSDLNFWEGLYDGKTQHDHAAVHAETVEIEQAYDHLLTNHQILNSLNSSEVNSGILKISERQKIVEALQRTGGNRTLAARYLGMSRRTFYRRLKQYGITE